MRAAAVGSEPTKRKIFENITVGHKLKKSEMYALPLKL
jgi:hypothetical protein